MTQMIAIMIYGLAVLNVMAQNCGRETRCYSQTAPASDDAETHVEATVLGCAGIALEGGCFAGRSGTPIMSNSGGCIRTR